MSARAPQAIWNLWYAIHREIPRSLLGGIVGDVAHSFGYHLARRDLPATDYSVQLAKDKLGKADCASAIDVTLPPDLMITCTKRLIAAAKAHDPRLHVVREFCGTTNGASPHPYDVNSDFDDPNNTEGWDVSHTGHIHISFYREYADSAALLPVADVLAGKPLKYPPDSPKWSETVTRDEIVQLIKANSTDLTKVRGEIRDALQAVEFGGDHGHWTKDRFTPLVPDASKGDRDRLNALEVTP